MTSDALRSGHKQLAIAILQCALVVCLFGIGWAEDSAAPPLLLANELGPKVDPTKYLVSEKYVGLRPSRVTENFPGAAQS